MNYKKAYTVGALVKKHARIIVLWMSRSIGAVCVQTRVCVGVSVIVELFSGLFTICDWFYGVASVILNDRATVGGLILVVFVDNNATTVSCDQ